jgi:SAM-dependent methyltransferase
MYQVLEVSLADLPRLYHYKLNDGYKANFSLKGFDYPWLFGSRDWKKGERVLDVGPAYSSFPAEIHKSYGCEMWAVDDFGTLSNDPFWLRGQSPQQHIAEHPEIKYILERVGDPAHSSLPSGYFDVIYSISTLEHVPPAAMPAVWRHLDSLLKPGGEMLHAIDVSFPSNHGVKRFLAYLLADAIWPVLPFSLQVRSCQHSPRGHARLAFKTLGIRHPLGKELNLLNMALNPDILTENYESGLNRILKDKIADYRYHRVGSLLLRLKKLG